MNLSKLIHDVYKDERVRELELKKNEVKVTVEVMAEHMVKGLLEYGKLKMQGFFSLKIKKNKGRKIANPSTGEHMVIKDYYKVNITPSKNFKEQLKKIK